MNALHSLSIEPSFPETIETWIEIAWQDGSSPKAAVDGLIGLTEVLQQLREQQSLDPILDPNAPVRAETSRDELAVRLPLTPDK